MDDFLFDGIAISSSPLRDERLEAVLAVDVLQGFEGLATLPEAERARVLDILRR